MLGVLILDDDEDVLESLEEAFAQSGFLPCAVRSYDELVRRRDDALACRCAILDVNLGHGLPSGLDANRWLRDAGFSGDVLFLTGHGTDHPLVRQACRTPRTRVLRKPTSLDVLLKHVQGEGLE